MFKRKLTSIMVFFVVVPLIIVPGYFLIKGKQYYIVSGLICILSFVPFFASLERKKLQARELVTMACIIAAAVASRTAFFFLEQAKPTCAIVVLAAVVFGPEFGFVSGALSMLLSNMIFGQGMWTPFQMLGMGLTAFICGILFHKNRFKGKILIVGLVSGILCFAVYGLIVDTSSVFMWITDFRLKAALPVYISGLKFNVIHGVSTSVFIILFGKIVIEKLERVKYKYGLFSEKDI